MINFMSSWVKGLGLAIVIVSILEMLLPNNKIKKYIRVVMGLYILFNIISPFISNKDIFDISKINFDDYTTAQTSTSVNQTSMDDRIEELYQQELEKDIIKKLEEKGYSVTNCKVKAQITESQENTKIEKIKLKVEKSQEKPKEDKNIENQIVIQIQKIKPVNTSIEEKSSTNVNKSDIQNIKKFLIEEYGVEERCLEIK